MKLTKLKSFINEGENIKYFQSEEEILTPEIYLEKDSEMRGVWCATVYNINFPKYFDFESYKNEYYKLLDRMEEFHLNNLFFQIRPMNDAFYDSELNSYSKFFKDKDVNPEKDMLKFMIDEAHKRDIKFHAWLNPYRASTTLYKEAFRLSKDELQKIVDKEIENMEDKNFIKKTGDYVVSNDGMILLNPCSDQTINFLVETIKEIIEKYNVDGIHFDDYFFPESGLHQDFDDSLTYKNSNTNLNICDFRRYKITQLIKNLKEMISQKEKELNRKVSFGVSPFGIYKNRVEQGGSNTLGSELYRRWFADVKLWIEEDLLDYVLPQLYWEFEHSVARYADLVDWWSNVCFGKRCKLFIGLSLGRSGATPGYNHPDCFPEMIKYTQKYKNIEGICFWSSNNLWSHNETSEKGLKTIKKMFSKKVNNIL